MKYVDLFGFRTFHNPVTIRIEKNDDNYFLFWKVSNGFGGYDPSELTIIERKTLDRKTWQEFIERLKQADFWNLPSMEVEFGKDGAQWILEEQLRTSIMSLTGGRPTDEVSITNDVIFCLV